MMSSQRSDIEKINLIEEGKKKGINEAIKSNEVHLRTPLSKVPLLGDILLQQNKMNETVTMFLLAGNKFMPEMHLKQP